MRRTVARIAIVAATLQSCGPAARPHVASASAAVASATADAHTALAPIVAAITAAPPTPAASPIVIVTPVPPSHGMSVYSLPSGEPLWQTAEPIDARPIIAGDLVISHLRSEVVAWNARSGAIQWRAPDYGLSPIGVGADARYVAISLGVGGLDHRNAAAVVVDRTNGSVVYHDTTERSLGAPAVAAGYALFPWDGQNISIIDIAHGVEAARITNTEDVVSRVIHDGNAVYYGGPVIYRLTPGSGTGRRADATTYSFSRDDVPGRPHLLGSGYTASYAGINARERTQFALRLDPSQPGVRLLDDTVYFLYHRAVLAFDAATGAIRWGHLHDVDIAGIEPVHAGVLLVDATGALGWLDAHTGAFVSRRALGAPAAQAIFSTPLDLPLPREASDSPPGGGGLAEIVAARDDRLAPLRVLAVRGLANTPGPDAIRALVASATDMRAPSELRAAAGDALSRRTDGARTMLDALDAHYDYYRRTSVPPVAFLARALSALHDRRAVPLLVAHLRDPYTPASELVGIVVALRDLHDPAVMPALIDFVTMYHADRGPVPPVGASGAPMDDQTVPERDALVAAMNAAIDSIATSPNPVDRRRVRDLASDAATLESVRAEATHALAARAAPAIASSSPPPQAPAHALPLRATPEMIRRAFAAIRPRLLRCLPRGMAPMAVSIQFRYDGDGAVSNAVIRPSQLQACMAPLVTSARLPSTQVFGELRYYPLGP